jgi:spermidine/putrescine transport system permease protein
VLWTYYVLYVAFLYLPLVILAVFSFHNSSVLALPWRGFSLHWYRAAIYTPGLIDSLKVSLIVATAAGICATIAGSAVAVAVARFPFPGSGLLIVVALVPLIVPALGLAVALLLTFVAFGIPPGVPTVVVGHTVIAIPGVLLLVATRVIGIDRSLEEAAMDLGARWHRVLWRIYLPLLRPALVAGFISAFIVSFNDFYLADFLAGSDTTLPLYFYSGFRAPDVMPPTLALDTALTAVLIVVLGFVQLSVFAAARSRWRFRPKWRPGQPQSEDMGQSEPQAA